MLDRTCPLFRRIALTLALAFAITNLPLGAASAGMVSTEQAIGQAQTQEARTTVDAFMARAAVEEELRSLGVDPAEAQARLDTLSDAEAVALAERIDEMPAGQGAVGALVGAGVFIFIVLLITDLLGFTDVFEFTNKGSANPS